MADLRSKCTFQNQLTVTRLARNSINMNALPKEKTYNLIIHKTGNEEQAGERQNESKKDYRQLVGTLFRK